MFFWGGLSCTDHSSPGSGWTGKEAEVGLQSGAAHLCHVLWKLRVTTTERKWERERTTVFTWPTKQGLALFTSHDGSWNHEPDLGPLYLQLDKRTTAWVCNSPTSFHDGANAGPEDWNGGLPATGFAFGMRDYTREGNHMACIYFFPLIFHKGHLLCLTGNCTFRECVCAQKCACAWVCVCVILRKTPTRNGETDLFSTNSRLSVRRREKGEK